MFFLALMAIVGRRLGRGLRQAVGTTQEALAVGIAAALLGHLVFNTADAVALGAKPGIFLWALLGLAVCLPSSGGEAVPAEIELPRAPGASPLGRPGAG